MCQLYRVNLPMFGNKYKQYVLVSARMYLWAIFDAKYKDNVLLLRALRPKECYSFWGYKGLICQKMYKYNLQLYQPH